MGDKTNTNPAFGIVFLMMGISMTITFGLLFGPAFIGIGLPFAVLGFIFMGKSDDRQEGQQDK
ncbi:MAG: hypothetical protein RIC51_10370 [Erythrobacter sp.]|uniref:hypothetical protein n=1 Tax=Erythrobacter sp. TaxID=1042 RepID=UPI0032ED486A